ncbi:hypothetical protein B0T20DRAFT_121735 [Sordaria brevicollis]|uniref:Uncharacterized protein n=1 Tax=Sordaria brevicollis TaxID=83679 RepID=A0AAE0UFR0_SORBR|nr:hypothetical protein B0T20DRAFT_121735 [Sordaria brevicollis]
MAARHINVQEVLAAPAPERDKRQHERSIFLEYGPPQFAAPGQLLWPILLGMKREMAAKIWVNILWVAVGDSGTVGPADQVQEVADCRIDWISDTQLPQSLKLDPEGRQVPPLVLAVIQNLRAPTLAPDSPRGIPMFRLFIRLSHYPPELSSPFFHTCLLCSDKAIPIRYASNCNLTLRFPQSNSPPPAAPDGRANAQTVQPPPREPTEMSDEHKWYLNELKAAGFIGNFIDSVQT